MVSSFTFSLSVCLSFCLSFCLPVRLPAYLSESLFVFLSFCLFTHNDTFINISFLFIWSVLCFNFAFICLLHCPVLATFQFLNISYCRRLLFLGLSSRDENSILYQKNLINDSLLPTLYNVYCIPIYVKVWRRNITIFG